ncbi:MAG TPA: SIS domain-containing protein, partial [Eubacteriales bacterium]|nr:SIS domain-containing protein [Eubacteriales bacterium]
MSLMLTELRETPSIYKRSIGSNAGVCRAIADTMSINGINNIVTAARGTSHNAAIFFKQLIEQAAGIPVAHAAPYISTALKAPLLYYKTLFVAISQSGRSPDTLAVLNHATRSGAVTAALTNDILSPVAQAAGFSIDMAAGPERAVAATKTYNAELIALALLAEAISGKTLVSKDIGEITERAMAAFTPLEDKVLMAAKTAIILSRGLTESTAKECALKLMECCYKFTFASSTNEFMHGPQALVEKGTPVILIAPSGVFSEDFVKTAKTLADRGAHLISFTDLK